MGRPLGVEPLEGRHLLSASPFDLLVIGESVRRPTEPSDSGVDRDALIEDSTYRGLVVEDRPVVSGSGEGAFAVFGQADAQEEVTLDAGLEAAVRDALGKPTGAIAAADLLLLESLDASDRGIRSLDGLQYATNLVDLSLDHNAIADLTPLASLTHLETLSLWENQVSDLGPLVGLTSLQELYLDSNAIGDLTPLAGLTALTVLSLWDNQIAELAPLAGLMNLERLELWQNYVHDLTPLARLTRLEALDLGGNRLAHLQHFGDDFPGPVVASKGLTSSEAGQS